MESWTQVIVATIGAVLASSGFWAYMQHRDHAKAATTRLLMGVAYNTIYTQGVQYIARGWVTKDEFEELHRYFFTPYKTLGGNGVAEHIMNQVMSLPFRSESPVEEMIRQRVEGESSPNA